MGAKKKLPVALSKKRKNPDRHRTLEDGRPIAAAQEMNRMAEKKNNNNEKKRKRDGGGDGRKREGHKRGGGVRADQMTAKRKERNTLSHTHTKKETHTQVQVP